MQTPPFNPTHQRFDQKFTRLQFWGKEAVMYMDFDNESTADLDCGWRIEVLIPKVGQTVDEMGVRHGTVSVVNTLYDGHRTHICFNLIKNSETPCLDHEEVVRQAVAWMDRMLVKLSLDPTGANDLAKANLRAVEPTIARVGSVWFWDSGLPGELLDLRLKCYAVDNGLRSVE